MTIVNSNILFNIVPVQLQSDMRIGFNYLTYCPHRHKLAQENCTGRSGFLSAFLLSGEGILIL